MKFVDDDDDDIEASLIMTIRWQTNDVMEGRHGNAHLLWRISDDRCHLKVQTDDDGRQQHRYEREIHLATFRVHSNNGLREHETTLLLQLLHRHDSTTSSALNAPEATNGIS